MQIYARSHHILSHPYTLISTFPWSCPLLILTVLLLFLTLPSSLPQLLSTRPFHTLLLHHCNTTLTPLQHHFNHQFNIITTPRQRTHQTSLLLSPTTQKTVEKCLCQAMKGLQTQTNKELGCLFMSNQQYRLRELEMKLMPAVAKGEYRWEWEYVVCLLCICVVCVCCVN